MKSLVVFTGVFIWIVLMHEIWNVFSEFQINIIGTIYVSYFIVVLCYKLIKEL